MIPTDLHIPEAAQNETETPPEGRRLIPGGRRLGRFLPFAILLLVAVVLVRGVSKGEFNIDNDETIHAFTGRYIADFLSDLPLAHPVQYTYAYYAQYPALGIIHWPPFFHFVEALMFLLFGPSVVTARLTVLLFALVGLYFWWKLVKDLDNQWTASLSTLLLALSPGLLLYEKAVMLEVPSLAMSIMASYWWVRFLKEGRSRLLYAFVFSASLALLTKQQCIYLALFCPLAATILRKWRLLVGWSAVKAFAIMLLLVAPFYVLAFSVHLRVISAHLVHWQATSGPLFKVASSLIHRPSYYWAILPRQVGWLVLGLSFLGMLTFRLWARRENVLVMLAWILACYMTLTSFAAKDPRYIVYWLPPYMYFAAALLTNGSIPRRARGLAAVLAVALLGLNTSQAWSFQRPYVSGFAPVARRVTQNRECGVVLFDGDLAENFIFYARLYDEGRCFVVLRKALYVSAIVDRIGVQELVHTREELDQLIQEYGIKYVVVGDIGTPRFPIQRTLREYLQSGKFKLTDSFPIESNEPEWQGRRFLVYENERRGAPTEKFLRIRMLTLNYDIVVPLDPLISPTRR